RRTQRGQGLREVGGEPRLDARPGPRHRGGLAVFGPADETGRLRLFGWFAGAVVRRDVDAGPGGLQLAHPAQRYLRVVEVHRFQVSQGRKVTDARVAPRRHLQLEVAQARQAGEVHEPVVGDERVAEIE